MPSHGARRFDKFIALFFSPAGFSKTVSGTCRALSTHDHLQHGDCVKHVERFLSLQSVSYFPEAVFSLRLPGLTPPPASRHTSSSTQPLGRAPNLRYSKNDCNIQVPPTPLYGNGDPHGLRRAYCFFRSSLTEKIAERGAMRSANGWGKNKKAEIEKSKRKLGGGQRES